MIVRARHWLLAIVLGVFAGALITHGAAAAVSFETIAAPGDTHDGSRDSALLASAMSDPGSPAHGYTADLPCDPVDLRSHGTLSRLSEPGPRATYDYDDTQPLVQGDAVVSTNTEPVGSTDEDLSLLEPLGIAANTADIASARFAQTTVGEGFQKGGLFEGRTISDVVEDLGSGALSPKDIPINVVVRDGNTLILNTRSATALTRAGIPRSSWNVVNRTGNDLFEGLLNDQLRRNGLDSSGYEFPN